ncbi:hypothetical protein HK102_012663, partial [Quaeritorhiza haematococci]
LTDPSLPDNPIVLASDGFVNVTGYSREDIIPYNCRFLQGELTDRQAVRRIKEAIEKGQEVTELLLNYRKDGTPFWNLLFIAPLRNPDGRIRFFIGGQVDVTGNLNTEANITPLVDGTDSRASSTDLTNSHTDKPNANTPSSLRNQSFDSTKQHPTHPNRLITRVRRFLGIPLRDDPSAARINVGAETAIVDDSKGLKEQVQVFYTTYSKYLVLDPKKSAIVFVSWQLLTLLNIPQAQATAQLVGADFFSTFVGPLTRKSARKGLMSAYKEGRAATDAVVLNAELAGVAIGMK